MFRAKTLFIVGAGASVEIGLPTGASLKKTISGILDIRFDDFGYRQASGDVEIVNALRIHTKAVENSGDINPYLHVCWRIRDSMDQAISIDNFIHAHRDDPRIAVCGKLGIARAILKADRDSALYFDEEDRSSKLPFGRISETWYAKFFQMATEVVSKLSIESAFSNLSFIVFNYDRCIEHFLFHAFQNYYGISKEESATVVSQIPILHPYGRTGGLPWQEGQPKVRFGGKGNSLLDVAANIKTFTEQEEDRSSLSEIHRLVAESETIVFLGFAFHPLNMSLLTPDTPRAASRIFATAYGMSDSDTSIVEHDIKKTVASNSYRIVAENKMTCAKIFEEYWRSFPAK